MKNKKIKSKNKLLILTNLFLIFVLMVVGVYAWFAAQSDNRADAYDIQVFADNPLEISLDGETWGSNIDLYNFINNNNFEFKEVTGNGDPTKMWVPTLKQVQSGVEPGVLYAFPDVSDEDGNRKEWRTAVANKDYLELKIQMRSLDKLKVYLGSDSKAEPLSTVLTGADAGNPCETEYASGDSTFSKDCIVGALRVGYQSTAVGNKRVVWIPRSDIHLSNDIGTSKYTLEVKDDFSDLTQGNQFRMEEGLPYHWNYPDKHYRYVINQNLNSWYIINSGVTFTKSLPDTVDTIGDVNSEIAFLDTEKTYDGVKYYYTEATIAIWIEGCDTEARRALSGGKFNLTLALDSFSAS